MNKANTSDNKTSFIDLNIRIISSDVHTSVYDKHDDFGAHAASKFSVLKVIEIVILWVYCTIPLGISLFWHFFGIAFQLLKLFFFFAKDH